MTAEDVKFAMDYTMNPKNGAYGRGRLEHVDRVEVTGRHTLRIYLKRQTPLFLPALASIQTFSVIPKDSLPEGIQKPAAFPPGTGPFRFVEWKPNQQLVVVRHDGYWGAKPFLERVTFRPIADSTVRFVALRSGDIDLAIRAPLEWVRKLQQGDIKGVSYVEIANSGLFRLQFNAARPPFDNKKLRQAIAHAIDKRELIQGTFSGFGVPIIQKYPKGHLWYFDDIPSLSYDLNKSRALLKEAGYNGEPIEISGGNSGDIPTMASVLQAQLKRAGVPVKIQLLDSGASNQTARAGNFEIRIGAAGKTLDPSDTYGRDFGCEADLKRRVNNQTGYCDQEMEALINKAETEMSHEARRELFKRILTKVNDDVPTVFLAFVPRFFAFRDHVKGFTSIDDGTYRWFGGGLTHTWLEK
jgi:peptide/nickel transport system substrate-binding protein